MDHVSYFYAEWLAATRAALWRQGTNDLRKRLVAAAATVAARIGIIKDDAFTLAERPTGKK